MNFKRILTSLYFFFFSVFVDDRGMKTRNINETLIKNG